MLKTFLPRDQYFRFNAPIQPFDIDETRLFFNDKEGPESFFSDTWYTFVVAWSMSFTWVFWSFSSHSTILFFWAPWSGNEHVDGNSRVIKSIPKGVVRGPQ